MHTHTAQLAMVHIVDSEQKTEEFGQEVRLRRILAGSIEHAFEYALDIGCAKEAEHNLQSAG